jgi:hypothetical protein
MDAVRSRGMLTPIYSSISCYNQEDDASIYSEVQLKFTLLPENKLS